MRNEVKSASTFLANLLRLGNCLDNTMLESFRRHLEEALQRHYQQHWFPENPCKGSGYRCIRINHKMDPLILEAGTSCGLDEASLRQIFPHELTLWIDPREVSYRIGENGSICVLFECTYPSLPSMVPSAAPTTPSPQSSPEHFQPRQLHYTPPPSCKRSLHRSNGSSWEAYLVDPRNTQLATYVSS